jgi:CRP/FNR family cyclic AMP-dependent transcriptional regulator
MEGAQDSQDVRFAREFPAGFVLFREGEPGEVMYVLQSGAVRITKQTKTGGRDLALLGRGDFVGEMALLNGKPRSATATVVEDARCLVLDKDTLESMMRHSPEIALRLLRKLARRLDNADTMIAILLNPDPQARALLALRKRVDDAERDAQGRARVRLQHATLAQELGVAEDKIDDVLRRLRRVRIAEFDDGSDEILVNAHRLHEFFEFLEAPKEPT